MRQLSNETLGQISQGVALPEYDRRRLSVGIVHFGMGAFHRAHQAKVIDQLMRQGEAYDWAISGVGVRAEDSRMRAAMNSQDGLYSLIEKHSDGTRAVRVIGSVTNMLTLADDGAGAILDLLSAQETRIVSLTVTEGGYNINQSTGEFLLEHHDVVSDLQPSATPRTVFGLITEALRRRRDNAVAPFTVMSCDNLPGNGHVARHAILAFATAKDPELADWIAATVSFPSSMVDRITPATSDADRVEAARLLQLKDACPVVAEPFFQWVLEDEFVNGRPPYEAAGVELVQEVEAYETTKLRILNCGHQTLCYFGYLMGYRMVADATRDPLIRELLRRYALEEAIPTLPVIAGLDLVSYTEAGIERFSNEQVGDTIVRLCAESSDRIPKWLVPVILDRLSVGGDVRYSAAVVASWARYATGVDEQGEAIAVIDNRRDQVMSAAALGQDPLSFIRDPQLFGDLAKQPGFTGPYLNALQRIREVGAKAFLLELLETGVSKV